MILFTACKTLEGQGVETQTALSVQATIIAEQSHSDVQATLENQAAALETQSGLVTQQAAQLTAQSLRLTEVQPVIQGTPTLEIIPNPGGASGAEGTPVPPTAEVLPTPKPTIDIEKKLAETDILLFEDMAGVFNTRRYIKEALDEMGLKYTDTADMQGRFKEKLLGKAPDGKDWDLIISADEARSPRSSIKGEFFAYFQDYLENRKSAVIMETWNLDSILDPPVVDLLDNCGVEYHGDMFDLHLQSQIMYILQPNHPILTQPYVVPFVNVAYYWDANGDLGDLLRRKQAGNASLLLGRKPGEPNAYGTLAVCYDGRFILQTFSTHQFKQEDMVHLWQNYVRYALTQHYQKLE